MSGPTEYDNINQLNKGGTAKVFIANEVSTGRKVIIKKIEGCHDRRTRKFAEAEIKILKDILVNISIPKLLNFSEDGSAICIAEGYVPGSNLRELMVQNSLDSSSPFPRLQHMHVADVLRIFVELLQVLDHAHSVGARDGGPVVHFDVKPENIFV